MADRGDRPDAGLAPVLDELRARFRGVRDPRAVRVYLASRGYDERRIETVLAALGDEVEESGDAPAPAAPADPTASPTPAAAPTPEPPALRVPAPHERARFLPAAWGYLLQRRAAAGWSVAELENVIERALIHIDGRIGVDDLRALLDGAAGGSAQSPTLH